MTARITRRSADVHLRGGSEVGTRQALVELATTIGVAPPAEPEVTSFPASGGRTEFKVMCGWSGGWELSVFYRDDQSSPGSGESR